MSVLVDTSVWVEYFRSGELLSNVVYGALGSVPNFLNTINKPYPSNDFT